MNVHDQHRQKLWEIIESDFDGSRMNTTLWMAMFDVLKGLELWWRIKLIDTPAVSQWTRSVSITYGPNFMPRGYFENPWSPTLMLAIEWIEVDPIAVRDKRDMSQEIERRLQSVSVPYTWKGPVICITGHVRRAVS